MVFVLFFFARVGGGGGVAEVMVGNSIHSSTSITIFFSVFVTTCFLIFFLICLYVFVFRRLPLLFPNFRSVRVGTWQSRLLFLFCSFTAICEGVARNLIPHNGIQLPF